MISEVSRQPLTYGVVSNLILGRASVIITAEFWLGARGFKGAGIAAPFEILLMMARRVAVAHWVVMTVPSIRRRSRLMRIAETETSMALALATTAMPEMG